MMITANAVSLGLCDDPECRSVHIQFHIDDMMVAQAALGLQHIPSFIKKLQEVAYHLATENEK